MRKPLTHVVALCLALATVIVLSFQPAEAQLVNGELRGKVMDVQTNEPLPGGQVVLRGTSYGAAADLDGEYLIRSVPPGTYTAQARFVGYQPVTQQVTIVAGQTTTADFRMTVTAIPVDEIVVTGMAGEAERRTLGNTIATISTRDLGQVPVASLSEVLQGRAPGVVALVSSGQTGSGTALRIRGMTSVTQSNEPVVYIDGVRVDNFNGETFFTTGGQRPSRLNDISPSDIERVEVIKGASATTLYGSEAASGVIQIFTKRGTAGVPQVNFQHQLGWTTMPEVDIGQIVVTQDILDSLTRKGVNVAGLQNLKIGSDAINSVVRTGPLEAYEASVRGGLDFANYYVSGRYENELGALPTNQVRRYNFRANIDADVTDVLKLSVTTGYVNYALRRPNNDNNIFGFMGNTFLANVYNARPSNPWGEPFTPLSQVAQIESDQQVDRFTGGLTFTYRPLSTWTHRWTLGTDVVAEENTQLFGYGVGFALYPNGYRVNNRRTATKLTLEYVTSYKGDIMEDLNYSVTAGGQLAFDSDYQASADGQNFPAPGVKVVSAASIRYGYEARVKTITGGYFAQGQMGFRERLFLTLGARLDRSSTFGKDFGTQFYPKVGLSYVITEEDFWPVPEIINTLKLRTAYGQAGRQPGAFVAGRTYAAVAALNGVPAVTTANLGNPDLKPEVSDELEFGIDVGFFDSRYGIEFTYFSQTTKDAIINVPVAPSTGFLNAQAKNVGEVTNTGFELAVRTIPFRSEDLEVNLNGTLTLVKNKVTDLGGSAAIPFGLSSIGKIKEGYSISSLFGQRVVDVTTYDTFTSTATRYGTPIIGEEEYLGRTLPKYTGSISAGVMLFGSIQLSATGDWAAGHVIFNGTKQFMAQSSYNTYEPMRVIRAKLNDPNVLGDERRALQREYQKLNSSYRAMFVEKADFFKLREISITYTLPRAFTSGFSVRSMSLSFGIRNVFTITNYSGADPEVNFSGQVDISRGQDFLTFPQTRRWVATLNVSL